MDVTVNENAQSWLSRQTLAVKQKFNTKCAEAVRGDLSTWRSVGTSIYDFRASGNFRVVAVKGTETFEVKAIYRHATSGGKQKVCGETVSNY